MPQYPELQRQVMVDSQLISRGIHDERVLQAMRTIPRHLFVPDALRVHAYDDRPLPIGEGQTISQPYIVALMAELAQLTTRDRVLEVGAGSGYAAAILSRIVQEVDTVERVPALAKRAEQTLREVGCDNVQVHIGDGTLGWHESAPYDVVIVTAGAPAVPKALTQQVREGGTLIIPVGDSMGQKLLRLRKQSSGKVTEEAHEFVRFVPLIGEEGW